MKLINLSPLILIITLSACSVNKVDINQQQPAWMHVNSQTKAVVFDLVAGFDGSNNAFNYNGYYAGGVTLRVPDGWTVEVMLTNRDANAPHNIIVTYPYRIDDMPNELTSGAAVLKRAYTDDVYDGQKESMRFVAKAGQYWLFCGIMGHGINDMWINFEVSSTLSTPEVKVK
mgnify:CR=1 FL=1